MTPTRTESLALVVVIGLLLSAAALAFQPLMWRDPVPTAAQLYADHQGSP